MMVIANLFFHCCSVRFRQESSRGEIETTTGYCPTISSPPLSATVIVSHIVMSHQPQSSPSHKARLELVRLWRCLLVLLLPDSVLMVRAVWLQGGERTGLWLRPGLAAGQVGSAGATGESWCWYYCYSHRPEEEYLYPVTLSHTTQSTHKLCQ